MIHNVHNWQLRERMYVLIRVIVPFISNSLNGDF